MNFRVIKFVREVIINRNFPYYIFAVILFVALKLLYTQSTNDDLLFILTPTDSLVSIITGTYSVYQPEAGFLHEQLNIIVGKSCAGFNFMLLSFITLSFVTIRRPEKSIYKALIIPVTLIFAYIFTIFTNTCRIVVSIHVQSLADTIYTARPHELLHEATGIAINLGFLVLLFYLSEKIIQKRKYNEKPA